MDWFCSFCPVDRYDALPHCSHKCIGRCTYIPTAISIPIVAAVITVTSVTQAEKEPKPLERAADTMNIAITTSGSMIRITIVGMTLMMRPPTVVVRNLQYIPHRESDMVDVNTKYPKLTTEKGIACRKC